MLNLACVYDSDYCLLLASGLKFKDSRTVKECQQSCSKRGADHYALRSEYAFVLWQCLQLKRRLFLLRRSYLGYKDIFSPASGSGSSSFLLKFQGLWNRDGLLPHFFLQNTHTHKHSERETKGVKINLFNISLIRYAANMLFLFW